MKYKKVYILARQQLRINTRIFKQARSLVDEGWEVHLVGSKREDSAEYEMQDGYHIHRVTAVPLQSQVRKYKRGHNPKPLKSLFNIKISKGIGFQLMFDIPWIRAHIQRSRTKIRTATYWIPLWFIRRVRFIAMDLVFNYQFYKQVMKDPVRPAVIHSNDLHTLPAGVMLKRKLKIPLVYDVQELCADSAGFPIWYRIWSTIEEFILIRFTDKVMVINPEMAKVMEWRYRRKVDEVVLNCFAHAGEVDPNGPKSARVVMGIKEKHIVLYSGNMTIRRGISNTIRAVAQIPDTALLILGEGKHHEEFKELAHKVGVWDRTYWHDYIPYQEVPYFICSANVGTALTRNVSKNHWLSSPSKCFAYIQGEVPTVASNFPYFKELVVDNGIGTVCDPHDMERIIDALCWVLEHPQAFKHSLHKAKDKYCLENEGEKFLEIYRGLG